VKKNYEFAKKIMLLLTVAIFLVMSFSGCGKKDDENPTFKNLTISNDGLVLTLEFELEQDTLKEDFAVQRKVDSEDFSEITVVGVIDATSKKTATVALVALEIKETVQKVTYKVTYDGVSKEVPFEVRAFNASELAGIAVRVMIAALPVPVTLENKSSVVDARAAYVLLDAEGIAKVTNEAVLVAAEAKIAELEKIEADKATAAVVDGQIALLPLPEAITEETVVVDEAAVAAAREAYNALTPVQQAYVTKLTVLVAAEEKVAAVEAMVADKAAAAVVADMIDALSVPVTLDDEEDVVAAREAFEGLTEAQQVYVENINVLEDAEAEIVLLKEPVFAAAVDALIAALPDVADLTLADAVDVTAAAEAYDLLSEGAKALVTETVKLEECVAVMADMVEIAEAAEIEVAAFEALCAESAENSTVTTVQVALDAKPDATIYNGLADVDKQAFADRVEAAEAMLDMSLVSAFLAINVEGPINGNVGNQKSKTYVVSIKAAAEITVVKFNIGTVVYTDTIAEEGNVYSKNLVYAESTVAPMVTIVGYNAEGLEVEAKTINLASK
jgi:hypothetical protein